MSVVRHAVYLDHFLFLCSNNTGDVFLELFLEFRPDEILSCGYREDGLNVDLSEGVNLY